MKSIVIFSLVLIQFIVILSYGADLAGTWESRYKFGPVDELMTANIQQSGENILGSFSVQPSSGDKYSGIIFGTIEGDTVKAYYLSMGKAGTTPRLTITFIDSRIIDQNTLRGTFYVQDSEMNALSGPFEAIKVGWNDVS